MAADRDPSVLPPVARGLWELACRWPCVGGPTSRDEHLDYLWTYLCVGEMGLAFSLVLAGLDQTSAPLESDLELVAELLKQEFYEYWANPGSARSWVDAELRRARTDLRRARPS